MLQNNSIYLDYNSTTKMNIDVANLINHINLSHPLNASSIHSFGRKARSMIENAKMSICSALKIDFSKYNIIFTGSGSEANNLAINGIKTSSKIASKVEHLSILKANENLTLIDVDNNGQLNIDQLDDILSKQNSKVIVSILHANNETGVLQDLEKVQNIISKYKKNICFHSDLIQSIGKTTIDLNNTDLDSFTISAHKIGGPSGIGALFVRKNIEIQGLIQGGGQNLGIRAGTENVSLICGMALAINNSVNNLQNYNNHCSRIQKYLEQRLKQLNMSITIVGQNVERLCNTTCILTPNINNETLLIGMDLANIAISSGSACSSGKIAPSHVLLGMGYSNEYAKSAIRISTGIEVHEEHIDKFINEFIKISKNGDYCAK